MTTSTLRAIPTGEPGFQEALILLAPPHREAHPRLSGFGRSYYPLALGDAYADRSFVLTRGDTPVAAAICGSDGETFSQFGAPIRLHLAGELGAAMERELLRGLIEQLMRMAGSEKTLRLADRIGTALSPLGELCLSLEGKAELQVMATVDLTQEVEQINAAIRRRYRPLINWGKKNLRLEYINANAPSKEKFLEYQEFHKLVAGRVTRAQESWDAMYAALKNGAGELVLGYEGDALVSGAMIIDGFEISIYASGVYDRTKFDRPLAHWPMYDGILRARQRGRKIFEIGAVDKASNPSQKETQIAQFKRGFASHLVPELSWTVPVKEAAKDETF